MSIVRIVIQVAGVLAILMGLLWIGQGMGWVHWPAKGNFMLDQRVWAIRGALLSIVGIAAVFITRRR